MRHWINFALLFSFAILASTGIMAYALPFSITTTRVHMLFGGATLVLVLAHVVARSRYFSAKLSGHTRAPGTVAGAALVCATLLTLTVFNVWPARTVSDASYEARRKVEIVRSSPLAGFLNVPDQHRFVARQPGEDADTALSLLVRFREGLPHPPAMAVWAETSAGTLIETLYLDESLAFGEDVTFQDVKTRRHLLLPVWRHRYTVVSGVDPQGKIDGFTGATPEHTFTLDQNLKLGAENGFVLFVEVNAVRDPNTAYADADLGQPSVLYSAFIQPGKGNPYVLLELTAHGGTAVENGAPGYDFDGIDTAKNLIDLLLVKTETTKR